MTDTEFITILNSRPDFGEDFTAYFEWSLNHPQLQELSKEPQFQEWFSKAFNADGISDTDEHYAYCGDTEIDKELGSRLSWLSSCFERVEHLELSDESDFFPLYADAFMYNENKYWVLTMIGQGSISWLMTDAAFKNKYFKEN